MGSVFYIYTKYFIVPKKRGEEGNLFFCNQSINFTYQE